MLPAVFHTALWYIPESQRNEPSPAEFLIQTFPYHFLSLFQLSNDIKQLDGVSSNPIERSILEHCIVDYRNVTNGTEEKLSILEMLSVLPLDITNDLLKFIFKISMYDDEFNKVLENSIHSIMNPRFQDESWNCSVCQARRLDRGRNCPFLPKEGHDRHITYPVYGGVITECPIGKVNVSVTNKAVEAFRYRKQALLPEEGGIRNQTVFFMIASQKVEEIKNYYENQEQDKPKPRK